MKLNNSQEEILKDIKDGMTKKEISEKYSIKLYKIGQIAKENNLIIKRPKRSDKSRHEKIIKLLKEGNLSYEMIGAKFGVSKQRIYQFAREYDLRRNINGKVKKENLIHEIECEIKKGISYHELKDKFELNWSKLACLKRYGFDGNLSTRYRRIRNEEIISQFKVKTAREVLESNDRKIGDPNRVNTKDSIYRIATSNGFKKYPKIGDRCYGGIFEDKKILEFITDKRDNEAWTYKQISDALNEIGYLTITGKEFTPPNVRLKYKSFKKIKSKR